MAEFCKECLKKIVKDIYTADEYIESEYDDYCERCGKVIKIVIKIERKM